MEKWERECILKDLDYFVEIIDCSFKLTRSLKQVRVLSNEDVNKLEVRGKSNKHAPTALLLEILETRVNGFRHLIRSLYKTNQTGALMKLLRNAEQHQNRSIMLQEYGIEISTIDVPGIQVTFEGIRLPLCNLMKSVELTTIINKNLSVDLFEEILGNSVVQLTESTLPIPLPYYVPRSLSTDNEVDKSIFEETEDIIFVIENITLLELTKWVDELRKKHNRGNYNWKKSSSQINARYIKAGFILLEAPDHFEKLTEKTEPKAKLYWVRHDNGKFIFVKGFGSHATQKIQTFLRANDEDRYKQEDFILNYLKSSQKMPVILHDTAGMGKTTLLASMAQNIKKRLVYSNVIFIRFVEMIDYFYPKTTDNMITFEMVTKYVLNITKASSNKFRLEIQKALFENPHHRIYLFIDGYDEVNSKYLKLADKILELINNSFENVHIFITTRPHRSQELELLFGVTGHKILPFGQEDQVSFLTKFWQDRLGITNSNSLAPLAEKCLRTFKSNISTDERDIAGIPLQCMLVAELCSKYAKRDSLLFFEEEFQIKSMYEMYRKFLWERFALYDVDFYYQFHSDKAFALLFPGHIDLVESSDALYIVYRIGILEQSAITTTSFIHRTFAEFLVAERILGCFDSGVSVSFLKPDLFLNFFFENVLKYIEEDENASTLSVQGFRFLHTSMLKFLDSGIRDKKFCHLLSQTEIHALKTSTHYNRSNFIVLLCCCLRSNLFNLFAYILYLFFDFEQITDLKDQISAFSIFNNVKFKTHVREIASHLKLLALDCWEVLFFEAVHFTNFEMVEFTFKLIQFITGEEIKNCNLSLCISIAAHRGNFQIVHYLLQLNSYKFDQIAIDRCLELSYYDSDSIIIEKIEILNIFLPEGFANFKHKIKETYPLLSYRIHPKLIVHLLMLKADVKILTKTENNIFHLAAEYLKPDEFHNLFEFAIENNYSEYLCKVNQENLDPFQIAIRFMDVTTHTIDLVSRCHQNGIFRFNYYNYELDLAIQGGRSVRVVSDILSAITRDRQHDYLNYPSMICKNIPMSKCLVNRNYYLGETTLSLALKFNESNRNEIVQFLVKEGADVNKAFLNQPMGSGEILKLRYVNPLLFAIQNKLDKKVIDELLQNGAKTGKIKCLCLSSILLVFRVLFFWYFLLKDKSSDKYPVFFRKYSDMIAYAFITAPFVYFLSYNKYFNLVFGNLWGPVLGPIVFFVVYSSFVCIHRIVFLKSSRAFPFTIHFLIVILNFIVTSTLVWFLLYYIDKWTKNNSKS